MSKSKKNKTPKKSPLSEPSHDASPDYYDLEEVDEEDSFDEEAAVQDLQASISRDEGDATDFTELATDIHVISPVAASTEAIGLEPQPTAELYDEPLTEFASEEQGSTFERPISPPNLAQSATASAIQKSLVLGLGIQQREKSKRMVIHLPVHN